MGLYTYSKWIWKSSIRDKKATQIIKGLGELPYEKIKALGLLSLERVDGGVYDIAL